MINSNLSSQRDCCGDKKNNLAMELVTIGSMGWKNMLRKSFLMKFGIVDLSSTHTMHPVQKNTIYSGKFLRIIFQVQVQEGQYRRIFLLHAQLPKLFTGIKNGETCRKFLEEPSTYMMWVMTIKMKGTTNQESTD